MSTVTGKKRFDFGWIGLGIAFVGLLIVGIIFLVRRLKENKKMETTEEKTPIGQIVEKTSSELSEAEQKETFLEIYNAAKQLGFGESAALAVAGASAHETGRWKSELAQKYWNIFGMKSGGAGLGIESGNVKGYATYQNWEQSLQDYYEWAKAKGYPFSEDLTPEQHLQWFKSKKYFTDTLENYRKSVLSLINELNNP
jgi:flagellum-specific peptidoglycan hydrolase FlgJ